MIAEKYKLDFSKPIEIANDIFWIGIYLENDPFQCHPYLISNGDESILIDPGSMIQLDKLIQKIQMTCNFSDIKYIILHHQDPDLCAAVPTLETYINRDDLTIVTHSRMSVLIKHYGIKAKYYNIDQHDFLLQTKNRELQFYTTPYCHSPGAFVTYDVKTKVLFSSDIFGGLEESWSFYAGDDYFSYIEGFHMAYMPSRDILNYALRKIEELDIDLIAPQHGSIITREKIKPLIQKMKLMNCGLYIDRKYANDLQRTIEKLHNLQEEFARSLDEIKSLKRQQDVDYFLTSLLMQPLLGDWNESKKVIVNSVIIQKKSFQVKENYHQLGGDICLSGNLNFQGNPCTLFFNGDAMGKSVQGAGGAIVMGTVLNSILARGTKVIPKDPEVWLRQIYTEIQTIFLSFEGAMMVSGILGLINDNTGELLFINAEHPFLVLYRNNKAEFLEEEMTLRKFGMQNEGELIIQKKQLFPEDVLFLGSDGKDDLLLHDKNGKEELNEDNKLFLKIIEKSNGNLKKMIKLIYQIGDVIDDLSIQRIAFQPKEFKESAQVIPKESLFWIQVYSYIKNKKYNKALEILEGPSEKQNPKVLFCRGYCLVKERRYLKALKYLTQAIKKKPDYFLALKYAGLSHFKLQNLRRCIYYWKQALDLVPEDRLLSKYYPLVLERLERQKVLLGNKQIKE
jgi:glyoxylase-like metal-dependent hydrolase (beta-lactamase superfamily II)/tetratricopeptide (TPR) repeat protein